MNQSVKIETSPDITHYCSKCGVEKKPKLSIRETQEALIRKRAERRYPESFGFVSVEKSRLFCRCISNERASCRRLTESSVASYCFSFMRTEEEPISLSSQDNPFFNEMMEAYILKAESQIKNISEQITDQFRKHIAKEQNCIEANASSINKVGMLIQHLGTCLAQHKGLSELKVAYLNLISHFFSNISIFPYLNNSQFVDITTTFFLLVPNELDSISDELYLLSKNLIYYGLRRFTVDQRAKVLEIIGNNYQDPQLPHNAYTKLHLLKELLEHPERFEFKSLKNAYLYI